MTVPAASARYFHTMVPTTRNGLNVEVEVELRFNATTGEITASFFTLEPGSELPPSDVFAGFLPPEDGTGRGQGYISFTIRPKANLATGTAIRNIASIIFDTNPAITTDQIDPLNPAIGVDPNKQALVTINRTPPTSTVNSLPATVSTTAFTVNWAGSDLGSGIATYSIYVSANNGLFFAWLTNTTQTSAVYTGVNNTSYRFYVVAKDNVGLLQAVPSNAQASTTVNLPPVVPPIPPVVPPVVPPVRRHRLCLLYRRAPL